MSLGETGSSVDLGDSSKYSNENFEDRSGERFYVNNSSIVPNHGPFIERELG